MEFECMETSELVSPKRKSPCLGGVALTIAVTWTDLNSRQGSHGRPQPLSVVQENSADENGCHPCSAAHTYQIADTDTTPWRNWWTRQCGRKLAGRRPLEIFFLKDPLEILEDTKSVNVLNTPHRVATCRSEMGFRLSAIHVNFYWISFWGFGLHMLVYGLKFFFPKKKLRYALMLEKGRVLTSTSGRERACR